MDALITQAGQFIQTHQAWAGLIIFLMTFGESLFVIGIFLPATVLLMMSGGLVGSGTLAALPIFLWGFAGAVTGDALVMFSLWIFSGLVGAFSRPVTLFDTDRCRRHGHA